MSTFEDIKKEYNSIREDERKKLRDYLFSKDLENISKGGNAGKGKKKYTSGKRLTVPYDLSNWKFIEASKDGVNFFISLQAPDVDPNSNNKHTLTDRIGVSYYIGKYNTHIVCSNMKITDIELPLDNEKMERVYQMISDIAPLAKKWDEICIKYNLV